MLHSETESNARRYTSRIQKGGALFNEMRQLVRLWTDDSIDANRAEIIRRNPLNLETRARALDVVNRIFVPRFVQGPIKDGWKLLAPLEARGASASGVRPIYYWFTALAEPLMYDLSCEYLTAMRLKGIRAIDVRDVAAWVGERGDNWSESVTIKVTRALLAALRDFGVLEGRARKQLTAPPLPVGSFAYIAFCMHSEMGLASRKFIDYSDWRLFMLSPIEVEGLLLEAHQRKLLDYYAAGSSTSIAFPVASAEQYADVVLG